MSNRYSELLHSNSSGHTCSFKLNLIIKNRSINNKVTAAAAATAIVTAIRDVAPAIVHRTDNFQPFNDGPTEDFRVFREPIESSIEFAQVPIKAD